jgi:glyoxylate reductase
MRPSVFVVQGVPEEALEDLRRVAAVEMFEARDRMITPAELLDGVRGCDYLWVLGEVPVDARTMDAGNLRLIAIMEILSRSVDIAAATARGIPVTTLPNLDAVTTSTAEHTLGLLLARARRLGEGERLLRDGGWAQYQSMAVLGTRLVGKSLGIVGLGNVGRKLAGYARAIGMRVLYTDRTRLTRDEEALGVEWREIEALFTECDVIALTPTLTASSRGLVGSRLLGLMKPDAFLVNTSRGQVIDEGALVEALRERRIAGAALDVFESEPPTPGGGPHPGLLELDNVTLTPHLGTATRESRVEMARTVASGIVDAIEGRRPPNVVNREVYGEAPNPTLDRIG